MLNLLFQLLIKIDKPVRNNYRLILFPTIISLFFVSSCNEKKIKHSELLLVDSIVLDLYNTGNYQLNVIKGESEDSLLILFEKENKKIYKLNLLSNKLDTLDVAKNFLNKVSEVSIDKNILYGLGIDHNSVLKYNFNDKKIDIFSFPETIPNKYYYSIFIPFKFLNERTILQKIPSYNMLNSEERVQYYKSKLLSKISINNGKISEDEANVVFPKKYEKADYFDCYPIADFNPKSEIIINTFTHLDSIFINGNEIFTIKIPSEFTAQSPPVPDSLLGSYVFSKEYQILNPSNLKLLVNNEKILLFQKQKISLLNNQDERNEFDDAEKNLLVFDLENKKFINSYSIPKKYEVRGSIFFNSSLVIPNQDQSKNLILYVTKP